MPLLRVCGSCADPRCKTVTPDISCASQVVVAHELVVKAEQQHFYRMLLPKLRDDLELTFIGIVVKIFSDCYLIFCLNFGMFVIIQATFRQHSEVASPIPLQSVNLVCFPVSGVLFSLCGSTSVLIFWISQRPSSGTHADREKASRGESQQPRMVGTRCQLAFFLLC